MTKPKFRVVHLFVVTAILCVLFIAVVAALLVTRSVREQRAQKIALPVVFKLGGKVHSLTAPLGDSEYYITFDGCTLTREDVDRLVALNELIASGGYIGLSVEGAAISDADREHLRQLLPDVRMGSAADN